MIIDLNSDLGESFGAYKIGNDEAVLKFISSANIACGFHAGDPLVMKTTVAEAIKNKVSIGAHPGFPDLMGFGRRQMSISTEELKAYILYQVGALKAFTEAEGGTLQHVKLHGALYNMAAESEILSRAFCEAILALDPNLTILALSGSQMIQSAKILGLKTASEVFADRAYTKNGQLVSRQLEGAVIHDQKSILERVIQMVKQGKVKTLEGDWISIEVDSICLHGDHPEAVALSKAIRESLINEGCIIKSFGRKEG